jgi:hypothetical protein
MIAAIKSDVATGRMMNGRDGLTGGLVAAVAQDARTRSSTY